MGRPSECNSLPLVQWFLGNTAAVRFSFHCSTTADPSRSVCGTRKHCLLRLTGVRGTNYNINNIPLGFLTNALDTSRIGIPTQR